MKVEFVGKQTDKGRQSTLEGGTLTVKQLLDYLSSVCDRYEQLRDCPVAPSQIDVETIKTVFQTRLDAITRANVSADEHDRKKNIFQRVRNAMPTPRASTSLRGGDDPLGKVVKQDLCYAASAFYTFFAASKPGVIGSILFCFNASFVFASAYELFNAIDVAGPLMATCFYSLVVFAYFSRENRMLELALFFCLLAFMVAATTGMFRALLCVLLSLLIVAKLSEDGMVVLKEVAKKLARPPPNRFQ